jgi:RNA polymerase sigma-70 factor (ECF subfamily)
MTNLDSPDRTGLAAEFDRHRPYLRGIAYRMLGSMSEADDAVQEAWFRLDRRPPAERDPHDGLRPWLTTVVGRICLDMLRSRRARREDYGGSWLPEPVVGSAASAVVEPDGGPSPEAVSDLADSIGLALLVVLDTLTPAERLAFVLHDVFAMPFDEIAPVLGRTPEATRQLASRGRRRVRTAGASANDDVSIQRGVVDAFLAAARGGDFEAFLRILDPDVVLRTDGGAGPGPLAQPPITGRRPVTEWLMSGNATFAPLCRPAMVNGAPGLVVGKPGHVIGVVAFRVVEGLVREIDLVADPAKLRYADG